MTSKSGTLAATSLPNSVSGNTFNADNGMTSFGGATLTYDANGNLTSDGTNNYTWDAKNHLTAISGAVAASFTYDAFGRRASKTIAGTATQFLYDGLNPVQELQVGAPSANLLTGGRIDEYFARTDSSNNVSTLLTDLIGSTIGLVGPAQTIATSYSYEPFGATATAGAANGNSYQFTGRETDGTGLYFYRARYYSPAFQRFIGQDRIDFAGGTANLYAYAYNRPTGFRDPRGTIGLDPVTGVIFGVLGGGLAWYAVYTSSPDATAMQYAVAILTGAVTGALTGGLTGLSPLATLGAGAASGLANYFANGFAQPPSVMNNRCSLGGGAAGAGNGAIGAGVAGIGGALGLPPAAAGAVGQAVESGLDISWGLDENVSRETFLVQENETRRFRSRT